MIHAARKSISSVAPLLKDSQFGYPTTFFGVMDLVFMLSYAIGMIFTTVLGDIYNPLIVTLLAAALAAMFQCILGVLVIFLYTPSYYYFYYFINACIGVSQSPVWPALIKVMSDYLGVNHSGVLFGIWVTSSPVGNIVGANLASLMLILFGSSSKAVIPGTFIAAAILLVLTSTVTYCAVSPQPASVDSPAASHEKERSESRLASSGNSCDSSHVEQAGTFTPSDEGKINFWRAWFIPGVIVYAIVTACVKGVAYALFFWLPLYLYEHASIAPMHANVMDTVYHVGGVIGSLACGWLSDRMVDVPGSGRAPALLLFQLLALITLSLMHAHQPTVAYLYVMLSLAGIFVGGAHAILCSAICTDLARQDALRGNRAALYNKV
ncbi:hypothetical protein FOL47_000178 [Perkinsus chesapeaki]|uniref:Major facilitator superfamily (MFS) profile domain-containing protein n=1 Tax=Perkinsus chesapeaki TaxID=330153 RepID=A0A7J6KXB4_PERCH|nr:hypothetical protein FOL47_000178 [Perkinsus chesapeaki]